MSKLLCSCGDVIVDQTDDLPYKAGLVPDSDAGDFLEAVAVGAAGLADSVANGTLEQWVSTAFGSGYPRELGVADVFSDFVTGKALKITRDVYQCETCGRLYVEKAPGTGTFFRFSPDDGTPNTVFRKQ